ncbi:MAG: T9SS type A sorting domain-containing protein, partial [Candidatus Latescibacterota bacterium]|nr:T9SS type A sorting domain-containing protein [Candidatus Latescibacterota bacterium]
IGTGVAASFAVEVIRRPLGDRGLISIEERGHDRTSIYVTTDVPGQEQRFGQPLGHLDLRIGGFQIQDFPSIKLVEGEIDTVYADLDAFVDQEGAQVIWTSSFINGLNTVIDPDNRVIMNPKGLVGDTTVVFTAFEVTEGNEDAVIVPLKILSRPQILGLPSTVSFDEDTTSEPLPLDDFVLDLDTQDSDLTWTSTNGSFIRVDIDARRQAVFSADTDAFGSGEIRLVVSDGDGLTDTVLTRVVVNPVNDGPTVRRPPPVYPRLGESMAIPLSELIEDTDDELEDLDISLAAEGGITADLSADGQSLILSGTLTGRGLVHFNVSDSDISTSGRQIAVVLESTGSVPPKIAALPPLRFVSGQPGTTDLNAYVSDDSSAAALQWTAASPKEVHPTVRDGVLLVVADPSFVGTSVVTLTVTDPQQNQDTAVLEVVVLPVGQAVAPHISAPPKIGLVAGSNSAATTTLDLDAMVDDPDGTDEAIVWTISASTGLVPDFDATTRQLRLTAEFATPGIGALTLTATDESLLSDDRSVPVLIVSDAAIPLIAEIPEFVLDSTAAVGRIDLDGLVFDDFDFESELVWTAMGEPGIEVTLNPVTHLLRITRADGDLSLPPSEARVILSVLDTEGKVRSGEVKISLPPLFQLRPAPELTLFVGGQDSSLVLSNFVIDTATPSAVTWSVAPGTRLETTIESNSTRVHVRSPDLNFVGSEVLTFTATDASGRTRKVPVRVTVRGRGLAPQIRQLPSLQILAGTENGEIDLDNFVSDDDSTSVLLWSAGSLPDVAVAVDRLSHQLSITPDETSTGPRTIQLIVRDPAGNTALGFIEINILRSGEPPIVGELPQVLLLAGAPEESFALDVFVSDGDTDDSEIRWTASSEPGLSARIEGSRLFLAVPAGQTGSKQVVLAATDLQGNVDEGVLIVLIRQDQQAPRFTIEVRRDPTGNSGVLEVVVEPNEALSGMPEVRLSGRNAEVSDLGDGRFLSPYVIPPFEGEQVLEVEVKGTDRAGNEGQSLGEIALRPLGEEGGTLPSADGSAMLNVPDAAAGTGRLAMLQRLESADVPAEARDNTDPSSIYRVDVAAGAMLDSPVTLNLFAGSAAARPGRGIERFNPDTGMWEDVPTAADENSGWFSVALKEPGLYRIGDVEKSARRLAQRLSNYPNPFNAERVAATNIEYEVTREGPVRLEVYNVLGQRVRILVDESLQSAGLWTVNWDGRDDQKRRLATGVYLYQLQELGDSHPRVRSLLLLR